MTAAKSNSTDRVAFAANWKARIGWILLALYVVYAGSQLGFSAERFSSGLEHGHRFLARMFPRTSAAGS